MAKRGTKYKEDYVTHWEKQGEYGKLRVLRMRIRKQKRNDKLMNRVRNGLRRTKDGRLQQVCDYQPLGSFHVSWCDYPCQGDC